MTTSEQSAGVVRSAASASAMTPHIIFRSIRRALLYIALSIAAFISIFPFYWMVVGSTNTSPDIAHGKASPGTYLFQNIAAFFATVDVPRMFWNSALLALVGVALTLIVSSLVQQPRERRVRALLSRALRLVADQRGRTVATAFAATALDDAQLSRLGAALSQRYGVDVTVNLVVDPAVVGGVRIEIGDDVIDATVSSRLNDLRQRLAG